jgi:rubrerythrin
MAQLNADEEVLQLAISRESDANQFYLAMARKMRDESMARFLEELAEEERQHREILELELMKSGKVVDTRSDLPEAAEFASADERNLSLTYADLLLMAMKKEETSFRLYVDLAGHVKDADTKRTLLELAEFEMKHKLRFQAEYERVLKNEG